MMMSTNDVSSENSIEIRENFPNVIVKLGKPSDLFSILNKLFCFSLENKLQKFCLSGKGETSSVTSTLTNSKSAYNFI